VGGQSAKSSHDHSGGNKIELSAKITAVKYLNGGLQSIGESPIKENCPSEVMYPKENTNSYEC
jgi:hypothetical protein